MRIVDGFCLRDVMGRPTVMGESASLVNFNKLVTFNESAAFLWRSVEGRDFAVEDLAGLLVTRYRIPESEAMADASEILQGWEKVGLVRR